MSDRVGEVLEVVQTYTGWFASAWQAQAAKADQAAKTGAPTDQTKVALEGAALGITSVVKAGIAALNSVAIVLLLDDPSAVTKSAYETDGSAGVRSLAFVGDLTHAETGQAMPASRVAIFPTTLADGETGYVLTCPLGGGFAGPYMGTVSVTAAGVEVESMTVFVNL